MRSFIALVSLLGFAAPSFAQFGQLTYNFFGPADTQTIAFPAALSSASNMTFSTVTNVPTANTLLTKQWAAQIAPDLTTYYNFSFTTAQELSVTSIFLNAQVSNVGPSLLDLRSSLDGFAATIETKTLPQNATTPITYTLPPGTFGNIPSGTNLEFRFYGYAASNNGTNSQFGISSTSPTNHGVIVTTFTPVPEPGMILGFSVAGIAGLGLLRRRYGRHRS